MEKFTKWSDRKTGIHPFLEQDINVKTILQSKGMGIILGLLFLFFRLPLVVFTFFHYFILKFIISSPLVLGLIGALIAIRTFNIILGIAFALSGFFILIPAVKRFILSSLSAIFGKSLLSILGAIVTEEHADLRKIGLIPSSAKLPQSIIGANVASGDIMICNINSCIDLLYYLSKFDPIFAVPAPVNQNDKKPFVAELSFSKAFLFFISKPKLYFTQKDNLIELPELVLKAKGTRQPIILFIEGTRTNGQGVIEFQNVFSHFSDIDPKIIKHYNTKIHLMTIKHNLLGINTTNAFIWFLISICLQPTLPLQVTYMSKQFLPVLPIFLESIANAKVNAKPGSKSLDDWLVKMRDYQTQLLNTPKLNLTVEDHASFYEYWWLLKEGKKEEAAKLAAKREKH